MTPRSRIIFEKLTAVQLPEKFPAFYETQEVYYNAHKKLPLISILSQMNPVHILTFYSFEIILTLQCYLKTIIVAVRSKA
jgi:hypothetical protein